MPPSHEQCRGRVCLLCFSKAKKDNNTFRSLTPSLWYKIQTHVIEGLDQQDERLPNVLCPTCVRALNEFDHPNKRQRKDIPVANYSRLYQVRTRASASSPCQCLVCEIAQSVPLGLSAARGATAMPCQPRNDIIHKSKEEIKRLCSSCLSEIGRGLPHKCCKTSRVQNLHKMASEGSPNSKEKVAAGIIKEKADGQSNASSLTLSTCTGRPITLLRSPPPNNQARTLLSSENISAIQNDMNLSRNETMKLANHIRTAANSRSAVQPRLKESLFEINHQLSDFFAKEDVKFIKEN